MNGKYEGFGRQIDYNFTYTGYFKNGQRTGNGKRIWLSGKEDKGNNDCYEKPYFSNDLHCTRITKEQNDAQYEKRQEEKRQLDLKIKAISSQSNKASFLVTK